MTGLSLLSLCNLLFLFFFLHINLKSSHVCRSTVAPSIHSRKEKTVCVTSHVGETMSAPSAFNPPHTSRIHISPAVANNIYGKDFFHWKGRISMTKSYGSTTAQAVHRENKKKDSEMIPLNSPSRCECTVVLTAPALQGFTQTHTSSSGQLLCKTHKVNIVTQHTPCGGLTS